MQAQTLRNTIPLWQPLPRRIWRAVHRLAQTLGRRAQDGLAPAAGRRRLDRAWHELHHLDAHTLKDIGAPEWTVRGAVERRESVHRPLDDFNVWRGV